MVAAPCVAIGTTTVTPAASKESRLPSACSKLWCLVGGLRAAAANVAFVLAGQSGLVTVAAGLASLYLVVTVLVAALGAVGERAQSPR
jgi:hypothetical protein